MNPGDFFSLSDFKSLTDNNAEPLRLQIARVGTLLGASAAFRFFFTNEECTQALLKMSITKGEPINILLTREEALQPRNRREMIAANEGWLFKNQTAPAAADLSTSLEYVPDINSPDGDKFNNVLEAHGKYAETPARQGLDGVVLYGHLVVFERDGPSDDGKDTHLVVFEFGSPKSRDGGLITLFKGRQILPHEIES